MNCPNCHQETETAAAFCGNCGQPLRSENKPTAAPPPAPPPLSPIARVVSQPDSAAGQRQPLYLAAAASGGAVASVPGYALAKPGQHIGETKALLALLFGIAGLAGALFMALIGLGLGVAGIVLGTMSRSSTKRGLSTAGLIFSSLAVLTSLAVWTYAIKHDPRFSQNTASTNHSTAAPAIAASEISTPCYSAGLIDKFNVSNAADSCDIKAFNGATLDSSTDAYKVYADTSQAVNAANYAGLFKSALEKDVKDSLPGFSTDREMATEFAGSPAYVVNVSDKAHGIAIIEAAVWHQVAAGDNIFIMVHAVNGRSADLSVLETQWQWK
ncbi:MAG TPA: hypothetical protein VMU97_00600 [Candidatus Dormibacteraeota bacterium]|nr:hypothetical protein [Candidatus Dormibacteraeota bacterium]HVA11302.1 hypothetical protein [Candidatus Dormibacteraeota bacterium]